ncbi:MAG: hypothetical protein ACRBBM_12615 [Pseudomonadaceae bacterium]
MLKRAALSVNDYHSVLQQCAASFLARHQGEHLTDEQALFDRAVAHLMSTHEISRCSAENIVFKASVQPRAPETGLGLDSMAKEAINFMQRMDPATSASVMCHSTAQYLKGLFDMSLETAQDAAAVAFARLRPSTLYHDVSRSDAQLVMLRDPERGVTYAVPVSFIVHHVIQNPARHTLHLVN